MSGRFDLRAGETRLDRPLHMQADLTFIGHIESQWTLSDCPKNLTRARETGQSAVLHILPAFRPALEGIATGDALVLLYWMGHAPRDLLRQTPRHRPEGTGTFNLRSPARPNPIGLGVVRVTHLDTDQGLVGIDAIDAVAGTPLIDIKPHLPSVDCPPEHGPPDD